MLNELKTLIGYEMKATLRNANALLLLLLIWPLLFLCAMVSITDRPTMMVKPPKPRVALTARCRDLAEILKKRAIVVQGFKGDPATAIKEEKYDVVISIPPLLSDDQQKSVDGKTEVPSDEKAKGDEKASSGGSEEKQDAGTSTANGKPDVAEKQANSLPPDSGITGQSSEDEPGKQDVGADAPGVPDAGTESQAASGSPPGDGKEKAVPGKPESDKTNMESKSQNSVEERLEVDNKQESADNVGGGSKTEAELDTAESSSSKSAGKQEPVTKSEKVSTTSSSSTGTTNGGKSDEDSQSGPLFPDDKDVVSVEGHALTINTYFDGRHHQWLVNGTYIMDDLIELQRVYLRKRIDQLGLTQPVEGTMNVKMTSVSGGIQGNGTPKLHDILPIGILFTAMVLGISIIMELITERRQNRLLLPTLLSPVSRKAVLVSPVVFTSFLVLIPVAIMIGGVYLLHSGDFFHSGGLTTLASSPEGLSLRRACLTFLLAIPLVITVESFTVCFACLYSTVDQARGASVVFSFMVLSLAGVPRIPGVEAAIIPFVPVANMVKSISDVIAGEFNVVAIVISVLFSLSISVLAVQLAKPIFERDDLVLGYRAPVDLWLERAYFTTDVFSLVALVLYLKLVWAPLLCKWNAAVGAALGSIFILIIPALVFMKLSMVEPKIILPFNSPRFMSTLAILPLAPLLTVLDFGSYSPQLSAGSVAGAVLLFGIIPAVCTEFFERGIVLGFFSKIWSMPKLVLLSGLTSFLLGLNLQAGLSNFFIGVVYGYIRIATGSLWPVIILHCLQSTAVIILHHHGYNELGATYLLASLVAALLSVRIMKRYLLSSN